MIDRIKYKDFIGSVHFFAEDEVFFGRLEGIDDLVTLEGITVKQIKQSFIESVENYLELCESTGKPVRKSFKGSFNVRIKPVLHSKAFEQALLEGKTLNQFVQDAIEKRINENA